MSNKSPAEIYFEFQYKSLFEVVQLLKHGVTFYFAIMAGLTGYLYTAALTPMEKNNLVQTAVLISIIFSIIMIAVASGTFLGAKNMRRTLESIDPEEFKRQNIQQFFSSIKYTTIVSGICCFLILVVLVLALTKQYQIS